MTLDGTPLVVNLNEAMAAISATLADLVEHYEDPAELAAAAFTAGARAGVVEMSALLIERGVPVDIDLDGAQLP